MNRRRFFWGLFVLFILMNVVAYQHAYKFTHFTNEVSVRTKDPKELSAFSKVKLLFTGIDNPKPKNKNFPLQDYQTIKIKSTEMLDCWMIGQPDAKGTVIMFHGYAGEKSSLLGRANELLKLGYQVFLVDFMGSGGSEGDGTSVGFTEAEQVKDCFNYISDNGEKNIILFGTSMGSAAILKAMDDHSLNVQSIIIECPFGSLYKTTKARFKLMNVPSFPMASMLCFWGGVQNGYWAFSHNPSEYAKSVTCPVLLLFGEQDNRVSAEETDLIFENLKGQKVLKKYPQEGHNVFTEENQIQWISDVTEFLHTSS
ncbi:MAG TPA: alpha/beta fold hydrolase [Chryseolinea sp.]|nr:alpha/beta fold hydrolase [Chryseolinea sp.]HPH45696.1 alpha/beta fold hydrolase [Chryseolinea sp.]HPM29297.1 alpha/beta fold hydrolase [Chryseolinea sp.]